EIAEFLIEFQDQVAIEPLIVVASIVDCSHRVVGAVSLKLPDTGAGLIVKAVKAHAVERAKPVGHLIIQINFPVYDLLITLIADIIDQEVWVSQPAAIRDKIVVKIARRVRIFPITNHVVIEIRRHSVGAYPRPVGRNVFLILNVVDIIRAFQLPETTGSVEAQIHTVVLIFRNDAILMHVLSRKEIGTVVVTTRK